MAADTSTSLQELLSDPQWVESFVQQLSSVMDDKLRLMLMKANADLERIQDNITTKKHSNHDSQYCDHNNRRTLWYHLVNSYGNVSLVYPTKESHYDSHSLQYLAEVIGGMSDDRANEHGLGLCRRCRSVVFRCSGCDKLTAYHNCYSRHSGYYTSLWCSRSCFEDNH